MSNRKKIKRKPAKRTDTSIDAFNRLKIMLAHDRPKALEIAARTQGALGLVLFAACRSESTEQAAASCDVTVDELNEVSEQLLDQVSRSSRKYATSIGRRTFGRPS